VRNSDLAEDSRVRERYPALAQAVLAGASGQVRNVATVAGNLLQRTRCAYFQDVTKPCNKRHPGSGCPAKDGDHRNLAVLGHSHACIATHPSDMAVALAAFDARVHLRGPEGERQIPVRQLYRLPGEEPHLDTVLQPGELITEVELSPAPDTVRSTYRKVRDRASFSFALVSIAAAVDVRAGRLRECHIAFGGLAHKPWRAFGAESALRDVEVTKDLLVDAARADLQEAEPLRDNAFKVPLARNLLVRTLLDLCEEPA
jgi:xanthine dehydrogenase YagS FAD-binding subunit